MHRYRSWYPHVKMVVSFAASLLISTTVVPLANMVPTITVPLKMVSVNIVPFISVSVTSRPQSQLQQSSPSTP